MRMRKAPIQLAHLDHGGARGTSEGRYSSTLWRHPGGSCPNYWRCGRCRGECLFWLVNVAVYILYLERLALDAGRLRIAIAVIFLILVDRDWLGYRDGTEK